MAETFKSAFRAYERVTVPLLVVDTAIAVWLVWDVNAPRMQKVLAGILFIALAWTMTLATVGIFAAKDALLDRWLAKKGGRT